MEAEAHPERDLFWQQLVIRLFRLGIQAGLHSQSATREDFCILLDIALFRELTERGETQPRMAVRLGCSPRLVRKLGGKSRKIQDVMDGSGTFLRVLSRLKQGPLSEAQLRRELHLETEFDVFSILLQLLYQEGIVEKRGQPALYHLTERWLKLESTGWEKPLSELEQTLVVSLSIIRCLTEGPKTKGKLRADLRLKSVEVSVLDTVLRSLIDHHFVEVHAEGPQNEQCYRLGDGTFSLLPDDRKARLRVGLLDMCDKLSLFLDYVLENQGQNWFGQRNWLFYARPQDLQDFGRAHRDFVFEQLKALEEKAHSTGDGVWATMAWVLSPLRK